MPSTAADTTQALREALAVADPEAVAGTDELQALRTLVAVFDPEAPPAMDLTTALRQLADALDPAGAPHVGMDELAAARDVLRAQGVDEADVLGTRDLLSAFRLKADNAAAPDPPFDDGLLADGDDFSAASWTPSGGTVAANPGGGWKLADADGDGAASVSQVLSVPLGPYVVAVEFAAAGYSWLQVNPSDNGGNFIQTTSGAGPGEFTQQDDANPFDEEYAPALTDLGGGRWRVEVEHVAAGTTLTLVLAAVPHDAPAAGAGVVLYSASVHAT